LLASRDYSNEVPVQKKLSLRQSHDFLSHRISIPVWHSNKFIILYEKFKKPLSKLSDWSFIDSEICNGNYITGPYWNGAGIRMGDVG
jgi:hypothetical protein